MSRAPSSLTRRWRGSRPGSPRPVPHTHTVSTNLRFRGKYTPGSELFIVFNESRETLRRGFPDLQSRALSVKINRLLRF